MIFIVIYYIKSKFMNNVIDNKFINILLTKEKNKII